MVAVTLGGSEPTMSVYTEGKNYNLESNRPMIQDDSLLKNNQTSHDPLDTGLIHRTPL
jgi:hypothetical protein